MDLGDRVIDGDAAQVYLYQLEVHAQGNISLTDKPPEYILTAIPLKLRAMNAPLRKRQHGFYPG